jgi:mannosyltransferase
MRHIQIRSEPGQRTHQRPFTDSFGGVALVGWARSAALRIPLDWALGALVGLGALGLDLYHAGDISLWFDEAYSFVRVHQPFLALWHDIWGLEPNMELYYVLLYVWLKVTSVLGLHPTELVLRLPSALCAALSTVVIFLMGRRFWGRIAGFLGATLYLLHPMQLFYAQQVRSYSLQLLLVSISWYAFLSALSAKRDERPWWAAYVGATTLAVYAHVFSGLIVVAQLVAFAGLYMLAGPWRERVRRSLVQLCISVGIIGILSIPMAYVIRNGGHNGWVPVANGTALQNLFLRSISWDSIVYLYVVGMICAVGAVGAALARLPWYGRLLDRVRLPQWWRSAQSLLVRAPSPGAFVLMCWLVVPVALSYALTQNTLNMHLFLDRYLVVIVPAICLLAGRGVTLVRWPGVQLALALALLGVALPQVPAYYRQVDTQSFRTATIWLEEHFQPGDGIGCYPSWFCGLPMNYYLTAYAGPAHFDADFPGATFDINALKTYSAKHRRVFLIIAVFNPTPETMTPLEMTQHWMDSHYALLAQVASSHMNYQFMAQDIATGVSVRLYSTESPSVPSTG